MASENEASNPMEQAPDAELRGSVDRLMRSVTQRLIEFCELGVPVLKTDAKTGETKLVGRAPAPAAYISAAVKFLKEAGAFGGGVSPAAATELDAQLAALPDFDDSDDEESAADA
ncbi:MAG: hypothetical protein MRY74_05775 [Neomegalonema sp.]|nr:hypothetical protein [Neomegalonema sp.]